MANQLLAAYIADRWGRRAGVVIGLIIIFVGTIIQCVPSVNSKTYIAGRYLVGLGYDDYILKKLFIVYVLTPSLVRTSIRLLPQC
jgi:MFS family permease